MPTGRAMTPGRRSLARRFLLLSGNTPIFQCGRRLIQVKRLVRRWRYSAEHQPMGVYGMHSIFQQLEADHQRMQRMLYELIHEIERFSGMHVTPANLDTILNGLDYIQTFPEAWHHPVENVVFRQLHSKLGINHYALNNVMRDHSMLEALSEQLSLIFAELRMGEQTLRPSLVRLARHYHSRQISHIHEERSIFSVADQLFTPADWEEIQQAITVEVGEDRLAERDAYLAALPLQRPAFDGAFVH